MGYVLPSLRQVAELAVKSIQAGKNDQILQASVAFAYLDGAKDMYTSWLLWALSVV